jgi:hypothetical protein
VRPFYVSIYRFQEKEFFAQVRPRPRGQATDKKLPARTRAHREKHFLERYMYQSMYQWIYSDSEKSPSPGFIE